VTYKATARRPGKGEPYVVRASSADVRDGEAWKLAFHQQTPLVTATSRQASDRRFQQVQRFQERLQRRSAASFDPDV
jgi:hypothetical protein